MTPKPLLQISDRVLQPVGLILELLQPPDFRPAHPSGLLLQATERRLGNVHLAAKSADRRAGSICPSAMEVYSSEIRFSGFGTLTLLLEMHLNFALGTE